MKLNAVLRQNILNSASFGEVILAVDKEGEFLPERSILLPYVTGGKNEA